MKYNSSSIEVMLLSLTKYMFQFISISKTAIWPMSPLKHCYSHHISSCILKKKKNRAGG